MHYGSMDHCQVLVICFGPIFQLHKKVMARKITTDCGDHKQAAAPAEYKRALTLI